ncbi:MAG TPA: HAD-IIIA family hydrolase [Pyrinomonadaceae bacterium]|nr:HAD-IIIA family hydrolase [Pyrinomonadaceae bacterium]
MTTPLQAVIFDFDYTLADSSQGALECINFALNEMGLERVSAEAACRTIGLSLNETFLTLAEHHEPRRCDEFYRLFAQRAEKVMTNLTVLYESVPHMIEALREGGLRLGIVSTKFRRRINEILEREALLHGFQVIIGGEDVEQHKPHPQGLLEAIQRLECSTASAVYVGDSVVDAELAKRAGVPLIVVLSGVTSRRDFDSYEPIAVLENLSELPEFLLSHTKYESHRG